MAPKSAVILALASTAMAFNRPGHAHEARSAGTPTTDPLTPAATHEGTAIGGALDPIYTGKVEGINIVSGPNYLTVEIQNHCDFPLTTAYASNAGCPGLIAGNTAAGTIPASGTASLVAPTNWAAAISINQYGGGRIINGDTSLIEANYVNPNANGFNVAVADVDISYVDGFSLPITCYCNGAKVSGCNANLWALNPCPNDDGVGSCINPLRNDENARAATTFFAPCQGQAYTFPKDDDGNAFGNCQNGLIQCCVGADC